MTHTTTIPTTTTPTPTIPASDASAMGNGNRKSTINSFSADNLAKHSGRNVYDSDVTKWSAGDVQSWLKEQCKKFELKKATAEKFELNGQALALLTKHDFLRRSPDGGEILYYALQRLINPHKVNAARLDQNLSKSGSSSQRPRIVELNGDDEAACPTDSSSPKPIIEEPDDPPKIRRSQSQTDESNLPRQHRSFAHPFFFAQVHPQATVFTMPPGSAAAYFQQQRQQQAFPHPHMFAHHPHAHMQRPSHFVHPHLIHQLHPMMSAQGILIEFLDDLVQHGLVPEGIHIPTNGAHESLYLVTMNGQRVVMNEDQVRQLVTAMHQRQVHQQQQQFYQQQQFQQHHQQQQQQYRQQQEQGYPEQYRF